MFATLRQDSVSAKHQSGLDAAIPAKMDPSTFPRTTYLDALVCAN